MLHLLLSCIELRQKQAYLQISQSLYTILTHPLYHAAVLLYNLEYERRLKSVYIMCDVSFDREEHRAQHGLLQHLTLTLIAVTLSV